MPPDIVLIDIPAQNLRGRVTVSGAMRFGAIKALGTVRFAEPEPDAQYFVTATCVAPRGEVPPAARNVFITNKTEPGFDVCLEQPPGTGNDVDVDWMLPR